MAENRPLSASVDPEEAPGSRYEPSGVSFRWTLNLSLALLVLLVVSSLVGWAYFRFMGMGEETAALRASRARRLPPGPRLQVNPGKDLGEMREKEDAILGSYGWVDRERAVIRIPVDRAIDLLARRGLPARAARPNEGGEKR